MMYYIFYYIFLFGLVLVIIGLVQLVRMLNQTDQAAQEWLAIHQKMPQMPKRQDLDYDPNLVVYKAGKQVRARRENGRIKIVKERKRKK